MKKKVWNIPAEVSVPRQLLEAGYTPLLAAVLATRGILTAQDAADFLKADASLLGDPFLLTDMRTAVDRIQLALKRGEKTAVYGDYDVDGITSTTLLTEFLRDLGMDIVPYIPDRLQEGYGLNNAAIDRLYTQGVKLIITVDCGVTAVEETCHAGELGVEMIITDHHECQAELPTAIAVVDPKRADCPYPYREIAGVGVAFKLACALSGDTAGMLARYSDLVAMGTVADVMPLTGENRYMVHVGLEKLRRNPRVGIAELMDASGVDRSRVSTTTVGYTLAPRINAAGRLGAVNKAKELFLSKEILPARRLAAELCDLNRERQRLEAEIWEEARQKLRGQTVTGPLVLAEQNWHQGVIGIAASRLSEEYSVPTVIIALDGEAGKGSCRSYGGFNLFEALSQASDILETFGGHALAAGLNIRRTHIDALREILQRYYDEHPPLDESGISPEVRISDSSMLSMACVESLEQLEPCGNANPRPNFCITNARLETVIPIGGGKHVKLRIEKFGQSYEAVWFSHPVDQLDVSAGDMVDIVFSPQINSFRGHDSIQLVLQEMRRADPAPVCRHVLAGGEVRADISRQELAGIWRALERACPMQMELGRLSELAVPIPPVKIALGLRVLSEVNLASLQIDQNHVNVMLVVRRDKADLMTSATWRRYHK